LIVPSEPLYVQGDPVRLTQIFGNLINNSYKYTSPGGRIIVKAERDGDDAVVSVRDTGIGIPRDQLENIFDMFTQIERSLERSQGGLGIGLSLVKRLAELHGGSVEAKSEGEGMGSEFVVRLPILTGHIPAVPSEPAASETTPKTRRILIVDDNRDAASSLAELLEITGNQTFMAHDGAAALEAVERHCPEVVLLDIGLPKISGYDVCRRVRQRSGGDEIIVIALTGWGQEEDRRQSREAGFDGHLVKPVGYADLMALLDQLTAQKSGARARQGM
jgi:CheY-like chemotaxis protein